MKQIGLFRNENVQVPEPIAGRDYFSITCLSSSASYCPRYANEVPNNFQYSYDKTSWMNVIIGTTYTITQGQTVYFKGEHPNTATFKTSHMRAMLSLLSGSLKLAGDLWSLYNFPDSLPNAAFMGLFRYNNAKIYAKDLVLKTNGGLVDTYNQMFANTTAQCVYELPTIGPGTFNSGDFAFNLHGNTGISASLITYATGIYGENDYFSALLSNCGGITLDNRGTLPDSAYEHN